MSASHPDVATERRWKHNPGLMQLLGLCPLLAVSNSVVNALGLGLATLLVLTGSNLLVSLCRHQLVPVIRLPALLLVIAALTTCAELLMQAYAFALYEALGLFMPLILTNCVLLGRADIIASLQPPRLALTEGFMIGTGFLLVLLLLGAMRELLGTGALFANLDALLPFASDWKVQLFHADNPFLLATLPPGAFLMLGFLLALKNVLDTRRAPRQPVAPAEPVVAGSKRVRVTGKV